VTRDVSHLREVETALEGAARRDDQAAAARSRSDWTDLPLPSGPSRVTNQPFAPRSRASTTGVYPGPRPIHRPAPRRPGHPSGRRPRVPSRPRGGGRHRASPPRRLGGLPRFAATGPIPPLGFDPPRRHVQPDDAFVDLGHRRGWQIQLGLQEAAGYGQKDLARAHDRPERRFVAVLDEPASLDVGEPERASWGLVPPTDDRRARRRAPPPTRSIRHVRHPSPRARRGCRVVGQSQIPDDCSPDGA
jgi:hypothetical protein